MAATAAAPRGATPSAAATTTSRFAAACGALSQYVRASEVMTRATPPAAAAPVRRPLSLMPGADVDHEEPEAAGPGLGPAPAAQLTIVYGGRVLVLDDVPADKAAELLRLAAAAAAVAQGSGTEQSGATCGGGGLISVAADLPVARKASLQRFMQKRKGRRDEPYRWPVPGGGRDDLALAL